MEFLPNDTKDLLPTLALMCANICFTWSPQRTSDWAQLHCKETSVWELLYNPDITRWHWTNPSKHPPALFYTQLCTQWWWNTLHHLRPLLGPISLSKAEAPEKHSLQSPAWFDFCRGGTKSLFCRAQVSSLCSPVPSQIKSLKQRISSPKQVVSTRHQIFNILTTE